MSMLFFQRYENLFNANENEPSDSLCEDLNFTIKRKLANVMEDFREPQLCQPNRYDDWTETTDALEVAYNILKYYLGYSPIPSFYIDNFTASNNEHSPLAGLSTPYLFTLVELQYAELSDYRGIYQEISQTSEREAFRKQINKVFQEENIPWLLVDGRLLKIDPRQFEQDLKIKALEQQRQLKDSDPRYDELIKAVDFLKRGDYPEAITNAAKSYESVMKIACTDEDNEVDNVSAFKLTEKLIGGPCLTLPSNLSATQFRDKVLMSLPYLRNQIAAHGAGARTPLTSKSLANLAVNLAAALDTYVIEEWTEWISRSESD